MKLITSCAPHATQKTQRQPGPCCNKKTWRRRSRYVFKKMVNKKHVRQRKSILEHFLELLFWHIFKHPLPDRCRPTMNFYVGSWRESCHLIFLFLHFLSSTKCTSKSTKNRRTFRIFPLSWRLSSHSTVRYRHGSERQEDSTSLLPGGSSGKC